MSNSRYLGTYFFYSLFIMVILLNSSCLKTKGIIREDTNQSQTDALAEVISETEMLPDPNLFFRITVIDEETKRGIPLVKLTTLSGVDYYTDSAGVVAFYEAGLMNREVFFHIESDGYSIEKDP